jgi:hypothetical protein
LIPQHEVLAELFVVEVPRRPQRLGTAKPEVGLKEALQHVSDDSAFREKRSSMKKQVQPLQCRLTSVRFAPRGGPSMATTVTKAVLGTPAVDFQLLATDGTTRTLDDVAGKKGTVIVFICNHCPYVKAVIDRLVADARVLMAEGIGFTAICSNDATGLPRGFV